MAITFKDAESPKPCPRFPTSRAARARGLSRCQHQDLPQTRRHGCLDASRFTKGPWPAAKFRASQNWPLKSHHKVCARWPFKPRLAASGLAASVTKMADSTSSSSIQGATAFALPKDDYLDEKHAPAALMQQQAILLLPCLRAHINLTVTALCPWRATAAHFVQGGVSLRG